MHAIRGPSLVLVAAAVAVLLIQCSDVRSVADDSP